MTISKLNLAKFFVVAMMSFALFSCSDDENQTINNDKNGTENPDDNNGNSDNDNGNGDTNKKEKYYVAVLTGDKNSKTDILVPTNDLESGEINPVGNGYELLKYSHYQQLGDDIVVIDYFNQSKEIFKFVEKYDKLEKQGSLNVGLNVFNQTMVDENTSIYAGSQLTGFDDREFYVVDTKNMQLKNTIKLKLEQNKLQLATAIPTGILYRDGKVFLSYINTLSTNFSAISLPLANEAKIAVLSYPDLKIEKTIKDLRCPNLGRLQCQTALQQDEKGDIYTFATSSVYCGMISPLIPYVAKAKSGILRIKKGETDFDKDFHINFEKIKPGYKINDMYYVADGKVVLRIVKEDQSFFNQANIRKNAWGAVDGKQNILETGILDLNTKEFTMLTEIPKSNGTFTSPYLVEGTKVYFQVSKPNEYSNIYSIDVATKQVKKGANVKGLVTAILK